ncbi:MAG: PH domain-containing protein [Acidimicrobiales bacterium]
MSAAPHWRRPHPLTVVVLIVGFITGNAFPLLAVLAFGGGGLGFDTVALIGGFATVAFGALGWFMTGFAVTDEAVHHRSGILNRQARAIPLERIQQVSVVEPVAARAVGLALVQVAEASADGDVEIRFLTKADAIELTARLRSMSRPAPPRATVEGERVSSLAPPPEPPAALLHLTSISALIRFELASIAPALAAVALLAPIVLAVIAWRVGPAAALANATVLGIVVTTILVFPLIGRIVVDGGFRLLRSSRSLTIEAGLLSRRQVEVRPDRIQTLTVRSGPVARRIDLHQIQFSAATGKATGGSVPINVLSPAAKGTEVERIVLGSVDVDPAFGVPLESVSELTIRRQLVRFAVAYAVVVLPASVALWFAHPVLAMVPTLVFWPPAVWYSRVRYRRYGMTIDGRRLVVRSGVVIEHLTQIPLANVQSVSSRTSLFQRRLGLSDLVVTTAGIGPSNHVSVPDLPAERCRALIDELATAAATTRWELRL